MTESPLVTARETKIASVLRPLGTAPMTRMQAVLAGELLKIHGGHVYRLRRRFLANPLVSSVALRSHGRKPGNRIDPDVESIVQAALHFWLPRQRQLAHPLLDLCKEIGRHCKACVWMKKTFKPFQHRRHGLAFGGRFGTAHGVSS